MRGVLGLALFVVALALSASLQAGTSSTTSLRIAYWEGPGGSPDVVWTLRCNPVGGTLSRPGVACRKLAAGGSKLFAPVSPDALCTQIYGGPQRARVVGVLAGKRIWSAFARTNGCEITRWQRVSPWLLPPGGVT
jgi:Subtilisin inhibitor-like